MTESAKVRSLKPQTNENLIAELKGWLEQAESGELVGAVLLGNLRGNEVQHAWAGALPLDRALFAFEKFKRRHLDE